MSLEEIFYIFEHAGLALMLACLIFYISYHKKCDDFACAVLGVILITGLHYLIEKKLMGLAADPENREMVRHLWYSGFAITDLIYVGAVVWICNKMYWTLNAVTQTMLFTYFAFALIQLIRYVDRIVIRTDVLGDFYSMSIPVMNCGIIVLVILTTLISTTKVRRSLASE